MAASWETAVKAFSIASSTLVAGTSMEIFLRQGPTSSILTVFDMIGCLYLTPAGFWAVLCACGAAVGTASARLRPGPTLLNGSAGLVL